MPDRQYICLNENTIFWNLGPQSALNSFQAILELGESFHLSEESSRCGEKTISSNVIVFFFNLELKEEVKNSEQFIQHSC